MSWYVEAVMDQAASIYCAAKDRTVLVWPEEELCPACLRPLGRKAWIWDGSLR